jgi:hypothetical protein
MSWSILSEAVRQPKVRDGERFLYIIERAGVRRDVIIELSGTLMGCEPEMLPSPLDDYRRTLGAALIEGWPADEPLPCEVRLSSTGMVPVAA